MFQIPFRDHQIKRVPLISTPRGQVWNKAFDGHSSPCQGLHFTQHWRVFAGSVLRTNSTPNLHIFGSGLLHPTAKYQKELGAVQMQREEGHKVLCPCRVPSESRWGLLGESKAREHGRNEGRAKRRHWSPVARGGHQHRHLAAHSHLHWVKPS